MAVPFSPESARWLARLAAVLVCACLLAPADGLAATIDGVVLDPDGRPVPGATIVLLAEGTVDTRLTSDQSGAFRADGLAAGTYELRVLIDGFRAAPLRLTLRETDTLPVRLTLSLSAVTETLVVSASQVETLRSSAPASVTVLTGAELMASQAETVTDGLRSVAGLSVAQSGGRGSLTSLFPRGGESDYTLVVVDGVRQNSFGGGFDFSTLGLGNVERVEVVRGPQSALFGSDAIGGVVHVITRRDGPLRVDALGEGGSFATTHAAAGTSGSAGRWSWGAGGERLVSDGYTGESQASGEPVTNDDSSLGSASASAGYASPTVAASLRAQLVMTERGFPGPYGSDPNGTFPGVDRISRGTTDSWSVALSTTMTPWTRGALRADATIADFDSTFDSPYGRSLADSRRLTGRLQADFRVAQRVTASAGVDAMDERARNTYITGGAAQPVPVERRVVGSFGELRAEGGRLVASLGVRVDAITREALEASPSLISPRPALPADTIVSANPRAAIGWLLRPARDDGWTRLRASVGTGIRPPDALEIAFTDNPGLAPERSRSVDAGIEHAMAGGALVIDAAAFINDYDDLIIAVGRSFQDASRFRTDNIANARAAGLELTLSARSRRGVTVRAAYTYLDTEVLSVDGHPGEAPAPFSPGDPLIRRPRHGASVYAALTRPRWGAFATIRARGETLDVDPSYGAFGGTVIAPGFVVADVGGSLTLGWGVDVFGRVTNLFDRAYEEVVGYPALGRSVMAGLRVARSR